MEMKMLALFFFALNLVGTTLAQNGVVTGLLSDGPTAAIGTTLNVYVDRPEGSGAGQWFPLGTPAVASARLQWRTEGTRRILTITNVQPSDQGPYFFLDGSFFASGDVSVVNSVVDGGFGPWGNWSGSSNCSVTCGGGERTISRTRECNNPPPMYGGADCVGLDQELQTSVCNANPCPINGGYGQWTQWSSFTTCTRTCGGGTQGRSRSRMCNNPIPQFGGNACVGNSTQTDVMSCATGSCSNPPTGDAQPLTDGVTAVIGRSVTISVTLLAPVATPIWYKGTVLMASGKYSIRNEGSVYYLTISNVQSADAGEYFFFGGPSTVQGNVETVDAPRVQGLCESAVERNGVGYRYHPDGGCASYIQCYDGGLAVSRSCPFGFLFNMRTFECDEHWEVDCPAAVNKCNGSCGTTFKIAGSCRSYWQCTERGLEPQCCPPGRGFVAGRGCRASPDCDDFCPSPYMSRETCMRRPVAASNSYEMFYGDLGWRQEACESGHYFNVDDCGCKERDEDAGQCTAAMSLDFSTGNLPSTVEASSVNFNAGIITFNEDSMVKINARDLDYGFPKMLTFKYQTSGSEHEEQVLAASSNSRRDNSVIVSLGDNKLYIKLQSWNGNMEYMALSTAGMGGEFKTVTLHYDNRYFTAMVQASGMTNRGRVYAPGVIMFEYDVFLGSDGTDERDKHFVGTMDDVNLYTCDPGIFYGAQ